MHDFWNPMKPRWKPYVFWISYPNHTLFSSDSSLDSKIYASKKKRRSRRKAFLITHLPLFTTMFTSQLAKEAEFKNAQPCFSKHIKNSCFVFHHRFQTPRNNKSTQPSASCFHLVSRCLEPMMKHSHLLYITSRLELRSTCQDNSD